MSTTLRASVGVPLLVVGLLGGCNAVAGLDGLTFSGAGGGGGEDGASATSAVSGATSTATGAGPCDPAVAAPTAECGVFVSDSLGHLGGAGTPDDPLRRLAAAILLAAESGKPVYACGESYDERLVLDAPVTIYGGLDCAAGWVETVDGRTVLAPKSAGIPLQVESTAGGSTLRGLHVVAADAKSNGGSSIAMLIDQASVTLERSELVAGLARAGSDAGSSGSGQVGLSGDAGVDACPAALSAAGGAAPTRLCDDGSSSSGGVGGAADLLAGPTGGGDGLPALQGSTGLGGNAQPAMGQSKCSDGAAGGAGSNGVDGESAATNGTLSSAGYTGTNGAAGMPGSPGQGGGGGGASRPASGDCGLGATTLAGASGGSGGTGGCGGPGGLGGEAGGSSIALVVLGAAVILNEVTLLSADAGKGGDGAPGAPGGNGGAGAPGGLGTGGVTAACSGGTGGKGGTGGAGGGGQGGHSLGVAYVGASPTGRFKATVGVAGLGGASGAPLGNAGVAGVATDALAF